MRQLSLSVLISTSLIAAGAARAEVTRPRQTASLASSTDLSLETVKRNELDCRNENHGALEPVDNTRERDEERLHCGALGQGGLGGGGSIGASHGSGRSGVPGAETVLIGSGTLASLGTASFGSGSAGSGSTAKDSTASSSAHSRPVRNDGPLPPGTPGTDDGSSGGGDRLVRPPGSSESPVGPGPAVPGPVAGAGLPGIIALLGYWLIRRRTARRPPSP
jgi:hypothetical protein